jgi:hypothetical protein
MGKCQRYRSDEQQEQAHDSPPMASAQRSNHRAPAFARCGLRSTGSDGPAIQRQANNGHNAATPGRINSLKVFGAPATL